MSPDIARKNNAAMTAIWCAMQELGAALDDVPETSDSPEWLQRLRNAVDEAQTAFDDMKARQADGVNTYRKGDSVFEAIQYTGKNQNAIADFYPTVCGTLGSTVIFIETLTGQVEADVGDWIIKDAAGNYLTCKDVVFFVEYEPV